MNRSSVVALLVVALYAGRASAPPPVSSFPAEVVPDGSGAVPANARVWIFGEGAPSLDDIGVVATVAGVSEAVGLEALGCCGVAVEVGAVLQVGDEVRVVVTSPGGDVDVELTIDTAADETPPTLTPPAVLDDRPGSLVLGVEGSDDVALAGFLARADGLVLSAAPPGFALPVSLGELRCVDVVAVDLAHNESPPRQVCSELSSDDEGPGHDDDGGGAPGFPSCASAKSPMPSSWGALLAMMLHGWRRRRRERR